MKLEEAIDKAFDECIQEGVLADFLTKNRAEAKAMFLEAFYEEILIRDMEKLSKIVGNQQVIKQRTE